MNFRKTIAALLAAAMLACALPFAAFAADWGEGDTLDGALSELKVGFDRYKLDWLALPGLGTIGLRYSYFMFKNERTGTVDEHPVYCIDPTKGGAYEIVSALGPNADGSDTATYIRGERAGDPKYRAILNSGYPQNMYSSLGLQSREEGYYATKLALWMYIRGNDPAALTINPGYASDDPAASRVREAAVSIFNSGMKIPSYEPGLSMSGKPDSAARLDAGGEYYVQEIEVYASGWIGTDPGASGDVRLSWDSAPPAGTAVLGANGEDITSSMGVAMAMQDGRDGRYGTATVKFPAAGLDPETFSPPTLNASALMSNSEIYVAYAKINRDKYQRYLVERDPKVELSASFVSQILWETDTGTGTGTDTGTDTGTGGRGTGLRIRKVQAGTNMPLAGAVFEIRDPDGRLIGSSATGDSGVIDMPLSVTGNYTVTETAPPRYHLLPQARTQSVAARYGEIAEATFADIPYGLLRVAKRDAANGRPLAGAAVRIRNIATGAAREGVTDSSGFAVFDRLPVGGYEITEIAAPDGYALDSPARTVNVTPLSEGETSYALTNKAKAGLRIVKFDRQAMAPIEGVAFEIWRDGELYGTYRTDAWGEIELRGLPAGTYTAREIATVPPYALDSTAQWIEIRDGQGYISELYFFNLQKPGMKLLKVDSETLRPLPNARFLISSAGGAYANEFLTDINGEIDLAALEPGAYQVQELAAPDGYLIDSGARAVQLNPG
ncbi:MAG: Cys-Gln thioester bond-forming surface protein, partial [Clostridiales bacterium]|nr:Cys-Gln thioester bond-forming surface protein [Clostridiales bacterium]